MTRQASARLAGATFLLYIVFGIASAVVSRRAAAGADDATRLATLAAHALELRVAVLITILTSVIALALAVALYALAREVDRELSLLALACRFMEGVLGATGAATTLGLLSVATAAAEGNGATGREVGGFLLQLRGWGPLIAATFFSVGSAIFSWLFLRGRLVPVALAWLGVVASLLLVIALPLQIAAVLSGMSAQLVWLPMLVFEVTLAVWLLTKGVADPRRIST